MDEYSMNKNIDWVEVFIDRVLCVVTQNNVCKSVKVSVCKHKHELDIIAPRVYTLTMKFESGAPSKVIELVFNWRDLNNNTSGAYIAIVGGVIKRLLADVALMKAKNSASVFFA
jgi:hypothetical protein